MLRWFISQLCRQSKHLPPELQVLYSNGAEPSTQRLVLALSGTLQKFDTVYLLVDAVDESQDRRKLLRILTTLAGPDFAKIKLLATSRREHDIEQAFRQVSTDISLSNEWVDEDIRRYIEQILSDKSRFGHWSDALRQDVKAALEDGAKGM